MVEMIEMIERREDCIIVSGRFDVLSSAVLNGGYVRDVEKILNVKVSEDFNEDAVEHLTNFIKKNFKVEFGKVVGMMTAVPMENAAIVTKNEVIAVVTAGISSSTVNIILIIDRNLRVSAMAEAIIVATEAKSAALYDMNVRDSSGDPMTGDLTDAIVVACRCSGCDDSGMEHNGDNGDREYGDEVASDDFGKESDEVTFAGKATELGTSIYDAVREAVRESLRKGGIDASDDDILRKLERCYGIRMDDIADAAFSLYVPAHVPASSVVRDAETKIGDRRISQQIATGRSTGGEELMKKNGESNGGRRSDEHRKHEENLRELFKHIVRKECEDLNVAALIYAAILLDEAVRKGWFGGETARSDASWIVADEIIGISIAEYIGGKNALFNFFRYDTKKPGILRKIPIFADDAVGGLIAGCMSKMLANME